MAMAGEEVLATDAPVNNHGADDGPAELPLGRPALSRQSLEDSFSSAGLLGLPEPADLLNAFQTAREAMVEHEKQLIDFETRTRDEERAEIQRLRAGVQNEISRSENDLRAVDERLSAIRSGEPALLADRAAIGSELTARRALYPEKLLEHRRRIRAQALRECADGISAERQLLAAAHEAAGLN